MNYFNYFTEIEEHFQRARGTGLFLLSPLDWALIESWKNGGVPLEAVLRGIDAAFEKWRSRKNRTQMVNSLAFCAQAVAKAAEEMAGGAPSRASTGTEGPVFALEEVQAHLERSAARLREAGFPSIAASVELILGDLPARLADPESLDRELTVLEDKLLAAIRTQKADAELMALRAQLDLELRAYRGKMNAAQIAMLEKQYLDRKLLQGASLPRLSLFYL
ncbi:MAG: hypothetical protein K2X35_20180 [Bryobacteraceae bacterium]|nr:hypothetical protein [Bryobacteraceae bacterium]